MADELTQDQRETLQASIAAAVAALTFVLEDAQWPRFCAWAEARTGATWATMQDRLAFEKDKTVLAMMGGFAHAPRNARQHKR